MGRWLSCQYGHQTPLWKAECDESRLLGLGRGKGCKALPIAIGEEERLVFPRPRWAGEHVGKRGGGSLCEESTIPS